MSHPDREEIIAAHPLLEYCRAHGLELHRAGREWACLCPLHREDTPSFIVNAEKQVWHCHGCGAGGSVIDLHAALHHLTGIEAMRQLAGENGKEHKDESRRPTSAAKNRTEPPLGREVAAYAYENAIGQVVYEVVRFEPKDFRQCRRVDGKRVWSMDGIERVLYRLPELLGNPLLVWIVEGERDVETLRAAGQTATCNPGGAGKWLPAYSEHLRGKCVYIVPDNDETGHKHARKVLSSLAGLVESVRWIELPSEHSGKPVKDITDLRETCDSRETFLDTLSALEKQSRLIERGIDSRFKTMAELEAQYIAGLEHYEESALYVCNWMPALGVRPLRAGDLLGIVADTGQLKTATLLNILAYNSDLPAVVFSLELADDPIFERLAGIATGTDTREIEDIYRAHKHVNWRKTGRFRNLLLCTDTLKMAEIDTEVARASAKLGCPPKVVAIDYAQLVPGPGARYERVSDTCEAARRLAKQHHAVVILVSQVSRPERGKNSAVREVSLHDAKETGAFENSCSLVLGMRKTSQTEMSCRVLKNSRGLAGNAAAMQILGGSFRIVPVGEGASLGENP
jgi:5S rRNA maturation endonuclease (ribonuclease M5)